MKIGNKIAIVVLWENLWFTKLFRIDQYVLEVIPGFGSFIDLLV